MLTIYQADNLDVLSRLADNSIDLIYIDPPFNTGKRQKHITLQTVLDSTGDRIGFQGKRYRAVQKSSLQGYSDQFEDYLQFISPRISEAYRVLSPSGSFFFHIDYREVHYCKVLIDLIFGRNSFVNEIIWAYDYGARSKSRWSTKHDTILWYAKDPNHYTFNYDEIDRIPYMSPSLVGEEKSSKGKTPTDVWWNTIVPTNSKERTGYPTQKPLGILNRIVRVHSKPDDTLLDFFAGSGSFGEAACQNDRNCILADSNPEAVSIMTTRLKSYNPEVIIL